MTLTRGGALRLNDVTEALNPAVLIPHSDGKTLYAICETIRDEGEVRRYTVNRDGTLTYHDAFRASGRSTCYLALSPRKDAAIVINYWDAIIDVVDADAEGRLGPVRQTFKQYYRPEGTWRQVVNREDHWGNRQVGPHAHCAHFWHEWVFIPDLGENAVFQYRYDPDAKTTDPRDLHPVRGRLRPAPYGDAPGPGHLLRLQRAVQHRLRRNSSTPVTRTP